MVNWFYVVGSERVGPVSEIMIKGLLANGEINNETYVWKKGFQGWERLKDVPELHTVSAETNTLNEIVTEDKVQEEKSPEVRFAFNWKKVKENEELFYIKIGKDRKNFEGQEVFGPYSLVELREALEAKRINSKTLIFAPGMDSWTKILHTPADAGLKGGGAGSNDLELEVAPIMIVMNHSPLPLITVVKKAGTKNLTLLGAGPFGEYQGKSVVASLYLGNDIKAKNVKLKIEKYQTKEQIVNCAVEKIDMEAQLLMLNHVV